MVPKQLRSSAIASGRQAGSNNRAAIEMSLDEIINHHWGRIQTTAVQL